MTSTATTGPSARAAMTSTGRLFRTPPSTSRRAVEPDRLDEPRQRHARADGLVELAAAMDDEVAADEVAR